MPHDRRVKLVVLTRKGEKTRSTLMAEFHQPPAEIEGLARADLEALRRLLAKIASPPADRTSRRRSR
jgi:DNA-binding MarR family transcriptional regulator